MWIFCYSGQTEKMKIETDWCIAECEETPEIKEAVFQKIMEYFKKHECFRGESIMQMDNPQIEAPELMADIADDILKFKFTYKDE